MVKKQNNNDATGAKRKVSKAADSMPRDDKRNTFLLAVTALAQAYEVGPVSVTFHSDCAADEATVCPMGKNWNKCLEYWGESHDRAGVCARCHKEAKK